MENRIEKSRLERRFWGESDENGRQHQEWKATQRLKEDCEEAGQRREIRETWRVHHVPGVTWLTESPWIGDSGGKPRTPGKESTTRRNTTKEEEDNNSKTVLIWIQ
ncbi:hypothetical protein NDU88_006127 [Pleurodeles waltl]|uniref:Uncharacterized protein n=1 Tax=Pleurodeles waltl TaxID=8319 RepID=A0AAV7LRJ1_PLEWA|nr:hypothetical protein NDU88_006127 [Pleurodeles waltl]